MQEDIINSIKFRLEVFTGMGYCVTAITMPDGQFEHCSNDRFDKLADTLPELIKMSFHDSEWQYVYQIKCEWLVRNTYLKNGMYYTKDSKDFS